MAFKYSLGADELKGKTGTSLYKAIFAEFFGIFILNFFGCAACTHAKGDEVLIALAFGLSVFMAAMTIGHVSGCHINPAVTFGLLAAGKISLIRAIFYVLAQCVGSVAGTASLAVLTNGTEIAIGIGHTQLNPTVSVYQGLGFEFFLGFILILCVVGVCDENKPDSRFIAPLAIGLTVTLGHLGVVTYTGSSMNPARSFGTAFITGDWENHWVYWLGPIAGGIAASLLYSIFFSAPDIEVHRSDKYRQVTQNDDKELRTLSA
ncbi:hypothetical protein PVAND_004995 [Polypedilum vanderplanki]|uniref:Aquaporin n=1 Tax=Polypedilum vanderplanki TaxID=319348 RepID=A5A7N9_POLVA|nr:hypothetical protein PVAND_004995 [Polypedilum vanderplanki]BAF62090.1 aquaporin [Polypedilum vanderplanki]